jgi:glycosyltransferase involved in cell wall biosynthesis/GT2 family glycosyltransferase
VTVPPRADERIPICYLAPWVDYGGADKGTIDWFRWLDRDRFAPLLVTTQPSANRRIHEIHRYAEEVWLLPEFLGGQHFPGCIFDLIHSRGVQVLHIMNARMGYELLPDLASLPKPPAVVVQLHVEEADRSGYVRYVTARYGNLVDAFSVSSRHLASVVEGYDVSPSKIRVIPTGVDAEEEFSPAKVSPIEAVQPGGFNILFPGRLAEQKDPWLMVEVMRRVVDVHSTVHVHVVGDGPLEADVRAGVREVGLASHVTFHPPSRDLARWYAACDLLLMTSVFEGVPYVVYEAMAMELPIVAPALPGNAELMADTAGVLVDPRDDLAAYASAVSGLIEDRARADTLGRGGRVRVLEHFSLRAMGDLHARLYDDLLRSRPWAAYARTDMPTEPIDAPERRQPVEAQIRSMPEQPTSLRFSNRSIQEQPLVSVVVPCFNHGRYLYECIDAILDQEYEAIEVIIVDDASTDPATIRVLHEIELRDRVRVIRQPQNSGPSAARNRAIKETKGRFILPVDSDNILLPGAVASLVEQLQSAGESVQYIYPNCQYFGTRDDYFQPPSFNLALLLAGNYCDTCSLIDRATFDAGLCYAEDIVLGHEDWDFALTLASHGVRGEPARRRTLLYRKHGFTRSDAVEHASHSFHEEIPKRHPELYGSDQSQGRFGRWWGPAAEIKAKHAPGLSIVMTAPIDFSTEAGERLLHQLEAQSCVDVELIVECPACPLEPRKHVIRRIPPGLCANEVDRLRESLRVVRANRILLAGQELTEMLAEPSFVEMLQRTFWANPRLEAIAFSDAGQDGRYPYRLLEDGEVGRPAHALAWSVEAQQKLPGSLLVREGMAAESVARMMSVKRIALQWRHAVSYPSESVHGTGVEGWLDLAGREGDYDPHRRAERAMTAELGPALPGLRWDVVRRWLEEISWIPPGTEVLTRHRELHGEKRLIKLGRVSPPGFTLERYLGAIQRFSPPGTVRLVQGEHGIRALERGSPRSEEDEELGHLELSPLPLFQAVERAVLPDGSESLAAGADDGLRSLAITLEFLGFIEAFPNEPALAPDARRRFHGMVALLRCVDWTTRRHVYHIGSAEGDELVGELGALHLTAEPGSIPVWIDEDGGVVTRRSIPESDSPDLRQLLRWVAAPARWTGFGHVRGRTRSIARRGLEATERIWTTFSVRHGLSPSVPRLQARMLQAPVGYLYPEAAPGRRELFAAIHPVTGDQLLTHHPLEAADMGYGAAVGLGYVLEQAPVTGTLAMRRVSIPWASRFGLEVRR